jgi:hypothetical protein
LNISECGYRLNAVLDWATLRGITTTKAHQPQRFSWAGAYGLSNVCRTGSNNSSFFQKNKKY